METPFRGSTPIDRFLTAVVDRDPEAIEAQLRKALNRDNSSRLSGELRSALTMALAQALYYQGRLEETRDLVLEVLLEDPGNRTALFWDAALAFKMDEPWPVAWKKLERGWTSKERPLPPERIWDGSPLNGRTILWAGEAGLGDQIQFARFAPLLKAAGAGRVIVSASAALQALFQTLNGVDDFVPKGDPAADSARDSTPYDVGISMIGVPGRLGAVTDALSCNVPYLCTAPEAIDAARRIIGPPQGATLNVGICWQSAKLIRSMPLEAMRPLKDVPGVRLFGLGERSLIEKECAGFGIESLGGADMMATAGALAALDLTISVDTMIAHLAGSLGRPVWTMRTQTTDFCWPRTGETTPWYPTMRLYRREGRDQEGLIRRVASDLELLLQARSESPG